MENYNKYESCFMPKWDRATLDAMDKPMKKLVDKTFKDLVKIRRGLTKIGHDYYVFQKRNPKLRLDLDQSLIEDYYIWELIKDK